MTMYPRFLQSLSVSALCFVLSTGSAFAFFTDYSLDNEEPQDVNSIEEAISEGETSFDFRLRYEDASQDLPVPQGAQAMTLRSRLFFQTQRFNLFTAGIRFDDIRALPDDKNYFSGTNGQLDDLLVADPELTEVSNAWLAYDIANTIIKYGKQDYNLGTQRLVGTNEWRQNTNTFNGLSIKNDSLNYTTLEFARFTRFENAFSPVDNEGISNPVVKLFNLTYRGFWMNDLSLYGVILDGQSDQPTWSTETYGIAFDGEAGDQHSVKLLLDYAKQVDMGNNPLDYSAKYHRADLEFAYNKRYGAKFGYEMLGADGEGFFVTPLASLHDYQGGLDIFSNGGLGNILGGVRDRHWEVFAMCSDSFKVSAIYHSFNSVDNSIGGGKLGSERGVSAEYHLSGFTFIGRYAKYSADNLGSDQQRLWLSTAYKF